LMAVRQDFLRQHYLDQVQGSAALPRRTLSLRSRHTPKPVGSPVMKKNLGCRAAPVK